VWNGSPHDALHNSATKKLHGRACHRMSGLPDMRLYFIKMTQLRQAGVAYAMSLGCHE
jgi:hypothetical protein